MNKKEMVEMFEKSNLELIENLQCTIRDLRSRLAEVEKERDELKGKLSEALPHKYDELHLIQGKLYLAQEENKKMREALEAIIEKHKSIEGNIHYLCQPDNGEVFSSFDAMRYLASNAIEAARAALADGKEGGR